MAKTIGGVRGTNEKKTIDPRYFRSGVFRNTEAKAAARNAYNEYISSERSVWSEMLETRSAIGTKKAAAQYEAELEQLDAEVRERFGTTDSYTIFTKSGLYQQKTAKETVQALQANTTVFRNYKPDTSSWWYRIARRDALEHAVHSTVFNHSGKLSNRDKMFFRALGS